MNAIKQLDNNKSCGLDGIYAEHMKCASKRVLPLLALSIRGSFIHGFLPDSMLSVCSYYQIIKNKHSRMRA